MSQQQKNIKIEWKNKTNMPGPLYAFNAVSMGNKIYAIGGRGKKKNHDRYNYVYDVTLDKWEVKREPMFSRSNHAVVALGKKIYIFGGNSNQNKVEVYNTSTDRWKELAPIPTPRMHINYSGAVSNGKILLIGGIHRTGERKFEVTDKNEEYNPSSNTWAEKRPLPAPRQANAVVNFQDKIYSIGGQNGKFENQKEVFVYTPETNSWELKAEMPQARFISGVAVIKNKIVVITGIVPDFKKSKVFIYYPIKDQWLDSGELPDYFMLAGTTSVQNKLYVLGGSDYKQILTRCLEGIIIENNPDHNN